MKVTTDRKTLKTVADQAQRLAGRRVTLPVLSHARIEHDGRTVTVAATNLETTYRGTVPSDGGEPGGVLVDAGRLATLAGKLDGDTVTLETLNDGRVRVSDEATEVRLRTGALDDYPTLPPIDDGRPVTIGEATLRSVVACASSDEDRPTLACVLLDAADGVVAATDSYRLAVADLDDRQDWSALLPADVVRTIVKTRPKAVTVTVPDGDRPDQVTVAAGRHCWTVRATEGTFPSWRNLWPDGHVAQVTVDAKALADAAGRVAMLASRNVPLGLAYAAGVLTVTASDQGQEVTVTLEADGTDAWEPMYLQPKFVIGHAKMFDGPVTLKMRHPLKPVVWEGDGELSLLQMPMRIG